MAIMACLYFHHFGSLSLKMVDSYPDDDSSSMDGCLDCCDNNDFSLNSSSFIKLSKRMLDAFNSSSCFKVDVRNNFDLPNVFSGLSSESSKTKQ